LLHDLEVVLCCLAVDKLPLLMYSDLLGAAAAAGPQMGIAVVAVVRLMLNPKPKPQASIASSSSAAAVASDGAELLGTSVS
jgi:hypothetical protein